MTEVDRFSSGVHTGLLRTVLPQRLCVTTELRDSLRYIVRRLMVVPVMEPEVDVNWLPNVTCKTISDVQPGYRLYRSVDDEDGGFPSNVAPELADNIGDTFAQDALWESGGDSSFSVDDHLVTATALQCLSKTVSSLGPQFADLIRSFAEYMQFLRAATSEVKKAVGQQKGFASVVRSSASNALDALAGLREGMAVSDRYEAELLANASAALGQIAMATEKLCQAWDMMSRPAKELVKTAQLKTSIKRVEENIALFVAIEEVMKDELAKALAEITFSREIINSTRSQEVDLRKTLAAKDAVIKSIVQNSCARFGSRLRSLVQISARLLICL